MANSLKCEWRDNCDGEVTHIDAKGYIYCTDHGVGRQSTQACRKLRPHEVKRLERGEALSHY